MSLTNISQLNLYFNVFITWRILTKDLIKRILRVLSDAKINSIVYFRYLSIFVLMTVNDTWHPPHSTFFIQSTHMLLFQIISVSIQPKFIILSQNSRIHPFKISRKIEHYQFLVYYKVNHQFKIYKKIKV